MTTFMRLNLAVFVWLLTLVTLATGTKAQSNLTPQIKKLIAYRLGGDRSALDDVARWVASVRSDQTRRREPAEELAAVLKSDASFEAKDFACRQLAFIAGEQEVTTLSALLKDENLAHSALMALARIP